MTAGRTSLCLLACCMGSVAASKITIDNTSNSFRVVSAVDGPLGAGGKVRGAAGKGFERRAKALGVDAMRTWDLTELPQVAREASAQGLRISAGIWMPQLQVHYDNCTDLGADPYWQHRLKITVEGVKAHKSSPALLWWTVGNEVELLVNRKAGSECIWRRVEWLAAAVRAEDPDHPVGTALAGVHVEKIRDIKRWCPTLDFIGVNEYGKAASEVGLALGSMGWTKPYALTEFGPSGYWDSAKTAWGVGMEPTSSEKALSYVATYTACRSHPHCLGSFAFMWGWKWERTGTLFNLFNKWSEVNAGCPDCETEPLGALASRWRGENSTLMGSITAVKVGGVRLPMGQFTVQKGAVAELELETGKGAPAGGVEVTWALTPESVSSSAGGAFEATLPGLPGVWSGTSATTVSGTTARLDTATLEAGGSYRLYAFAREAGKTCAAGPCARAEAHAAVALHLCHTSLPGEQCHAAVLAAMNSTPSQNAYLGNTSTLATLEDWQAALQSKGRGGCGVPCGVLACHTAIAGEPCHAAVTWAMTMGIHTNPEWYPGLSANSSFLEFQASMHWAGQPECQAPCPARPVVASPPANWTPSNSTEHCPFLAAKGDACHTAIEWTRQTGIPQQPHWYPGLTPASSPKQIQMVLHRMGNRNCPDPCATIPNATEGNVTNGTTAVPGCPLMARAGDGCFEKVAWAMSHGIHSTPGWYSGLNASSTFVEFQALLYRQGNGCPNPCPANNSNATCCCIARPKESCHREVTWAMETGIHTRPEWYPGLHSNSSFVEFQEILFWQGMGNCSHPCTTEEELSGGFALAPGAAVALAVMASLLRRSAQL